jgi:hypothetical protein
MPRSKAATASGDGGFGVARGGGGGGCRSEGADPAEDEGRECALWVFGFSALLALLGLAAGFDGLAAGFALALAVAALALGAGLADFFAVGPL